MTTDNKEIDVSVIFPIYGSFDRRRLELAIESVKMQKGINLEIIVSEQGKEPNFKTDSEIKHVFTKYEPKRGTHNYSPGAIRNHALRRSSGKYIYTNDGDVMFLNKHFLKELINLSQQNESMSYYRPPMRRLPVRDFESFYNKAQKIGIKETFKQLNLQNKYFASLNKVDYDLMVIEKKCAHYTKTFVAFAHEFELYKTNPLLKGHEPKIFNENRHCGGNFGLRKHFFDLGGYCEKYLNWGYEDSDLQWKFRQTSGIELVPFLPEFEVLHLDHSKDYFSTQMWKENEKEFIKREKEGVIICVEYDLTNFQNDKNSI